MQVFLEDQIFARGIERGIELRELLQSPHHGAQYKGERCELYAQCGGTLLELGARGFQIGNVGLIELRDVRQIDPARMQPSAGYAPDSAERLSLHCTELRKVRHLHAWQACPRPAARRTRAGRQKTLYERLDVALYDPALATRAA